VFVFAQQPPVGQGFLIHELYRSHTQWRTTIGKTPLGAWLARRRNLYLTSHNIHNRQISVSPGGILTHNLSRQAAADLRLRPRGHWDRPIKTMLSFLVQKCNYLAGRKINLDLMILKESRGFRHILCKREREVNWEILNKKSMKMKIVF
jgi:hypothetical protein